MTKHKVTITLESGDEGNDVEARIDMHGEFINDDWASHRMARHLLRVLVVPEHNPRNMRYEDADGNIIDAETGVRTQ